jgi:hypothetical protein
VRTRLPALDKSEPSQRPHRLRAVDIAGQFHATASTGSCVKWSRTCAGALPGSK